LIIRFLLVFFDFETGCAPAGHRFVNLFPADAAPLQKMERAHPAGDLIFVCKSACGSASRAFAAPSTPKHWLKVRQSVHRIRFVCIDCGVVRLSSQIFV
jgi:hypothetical protein